MFPCKNRKFAADKAIKYEIYHEKNALDICIQVRKDKEDVDLPTGEHVLTLVVKGDHKVIVAWVLTA